MKKNLYTIAVLLIGFIVGLTACSPDDYSLGGSISKDELIFSVKQDAQDPNTVYLEALNKGASVAWVTPQGRSLRAKDTLRIAFPGDYEFTYGVMTDAGYVKADPYILKITTTNLNYVQDEMWKLLTGGVGNEKVWVPDTGKYGMKQGFYSCFDPTSTYKDMVAEANTPYNWYARDKTWWEPGNADVGITDDDLNSTMIFSLKGKAGLTVHRFTDGVEAVLNGVFDMNTTAHTISAVDVDFLHGAWANGKAVDFRNGFQVLVLTENQLMIGNYRDEALSGEGRCVYSWNFVSKEWADNYVPEPEEPEPTEPTLPDGWKEDVSENETTITSTTIQWTLSTKSPVNWASQSGKLLNAWNSPADYPEWLGTPNPATYSDFAMTLDSKTLKATFTIPGGSAVETNYTLDEKGIYTFDVEIPAVTIVNWMTFRLSSTHTLRILQIIKDATGAVSDMWVGIPNPDNPDKEYIAYRMNPKAIGLGGGETAEEKVMKTLATQAWMLDMDGKVSYAHPTEGTFVGPTACYGWGGNWAPGKGTHYTTGLISDGKTENMNYGTMKFTKDGKVTVNQRRFKYEADGEGGVPYELTTQIPAMTTNARVTSEEVVTLQGTYTVDLSNNKIRMSVPMLHPYSATNMCNDWGDLEIIHISSTSLLLTVYRKAEVESVAPWVYVFTPEKIN